MNDESDALAKVANRNITQPRSVGAPPDGGNPPLDYPSWAVHRVPPDPRLIELTGAVVVLGAALAKQMLTAWLDREVTYDVRAYSTVAELLPAGPTDAPALIVLGLAWDHRPIEAILADIDKVRGHFGAAHVVAVVSEIHPAYVRELLARGVRGVIPTQTSSTLAGAAIRLVLAGGIYAPPDQHQSDWPIVGGKHLRAEQTSMQWTESAELMVRTYFKLSTRESEVLGHLRLGRSNGEIAAAVGISKNTVLVHVRHIMQKAGATNRTQVAFLVHQILSDRAPDAMTASASEPLGSGKID